ncbi:MAG TPA: hypothetical protein VJC03_01745, partial [bacterium]|nr:hypothetical protein [bacterium]
LFAGPSAEEAAKPYLRVEQEEERLSNLLSDAASPDNNHLYWNSLTAGERTEAKERIRKFTALSQLVRDFQDRTAKDISGLALQGDWLWGGDNLEIVIVDEGKDAPGGADEFREMLLGAGMHSLSDFAKRYTLRGQKKYAQQCGELMSLLRGETGINVTFTRVGKSWLYGQEGFGMERGDEARESFLSGLYTTGAVLWGYPAFSRMNKYRVQSSKISLWLQAEDYYSNEVLPLIGKPQTDETSSLFRVKLSNLYRLFGLMLDTDEERIALKTLLNPEESRIDAEEFQRTYLSADFIRKLNISATGRGAELQSKFMEEGISIAYGYSESDEELGREKSSLGIRHSEMDLLSDVKTGVSAVRKQLEINRSAGSRENKKSAAEIRLLTQHLSDIEGLADEEKRRMRSIAEELEALQKGPADASKLLDVLERVSQSSVRIEKLLQNRISAMSEEQEFIDSKLTRAMVSFFKVRLPSKAKQFAPLKLRIMQMRHFSFGKWFKLGETPSGENVEISFRISDHENAIAGSTANPKYNLLRINEVSRAAGTRRYSVEIERAVFDMEFKALENLIGESMPLLAELLDGRRMSEVRQGFKGRVEESPAAPGAMK